MYGIAAFVCGIEFFWIEPPLYVVLLVEVLRHHFFGLMFPYVALSEVEKSHCVSHLWAREWKPTHCALRFALRSPHPTLTPAPHATLLFPPPCTHPTPYSSILHFCL